MCQRRQNSVMDRAAYGRSKFSGSRNPEHRAQAERHVGIAAEVEVELDRVGHDADQGAGRPEFAGGDRERGVRDGRDGVGDQDLLAEPVGEAVDTGDEQRRGLDAAR